MTEGIGRVNEDHSYLNPFSGYTPQAVANNMEKFRKNKKAEWHIGEKRINCMEDIEIWKESGEFGRLMYYIENKRIFSNGLAFLRFNTEPSDYIWVCEADHLRRYHIREMEALEAHIRFAESRREINDYSEGEFILPQFILGNRVSQDRITWIDIPPDVEKVAYKCWDRDAEAPIFF